MAITDPHDPNRTFRRYVLFNLDGTIASAHDFEAGVACPLPGAVELTDLVPLDLDALAIDPAAVVALNAAVGDHVTKSAAVDKAVAELSSSVNALALVQASTRGALSVAAGKLQFASAIPAAPIVANG